MLGPNRILHVKLLTYLCTYPCTYLCTYAFAINKLSCFSELKVIRKVNIAKKSFFVARMKNLDRSNVGSNPTKIYHTASEHGFLAKVASKVLLYTPT
jgi:hypothetical protein